MKRMFFLALLAVAIGNASYSNAIVAEGRTQTALGDYMIKMSDNPVIINGDEYKTFMISYKNTPMEVRVAVKKERHCNKYIVLTDKLCVQYVCKPNYFGVERLDSSLEKNGYATLDQFLNRSEYFHQKVLTSGSGSELDNTRLIASYFPKLLKDIGEWVTVK